MRKVSLAIVFLLGLFPLLSQPAFAGFSPDTKCAGYHESGTFKNEYGKNSGESIKLDLKDLVPNTNYALVLRSTAGGYGTAEQKMTTNSTGRVSFSVPIPEISGGAKDNMEVVLLKEGNNLIECRFGTYAITETPLSCTYKIIQVRDGKNCFYQGDENSCLLEKVDINVEVVFTENGVPFANKPVSIQVTGGLGWLDETTDSSGKVTTTRSFDMGAAQSYELKGSDNIWGPNVRYCQGFPFTTKTSCTKDGKDMCSADETPITPKPTEPQEGVDPYDLCAQIPTPSLQAKCVDCAGLSGREGVWTAVGCIKRDPKSIIQSLMRIGLGMGGGVALLSTLAGGFILSTSQGNPQKADQAKEIITNSVIGLLFIIFSVVILQFIGVTIFNIPGFGTVK